MGRPKDESCRNQVEELRGGFVRCRRCKHKFKGGATRINAHVKGQKNKGVKICDYRVHDNEGVDIDNHVVAASSNPPQGLVNPTNSLQVAGGAHEMFDPIPIIAGSSNHPNYTQSNTLCEEVEMIDPIHIMAGSSNHPNCTQSDTLYEVAGGAHEMIDSIPIIAGSSNHPNYTQSNTLCEVGLHVEDVYEIKELVGILDREVNEVKGQLQWLKSHGKRCKKHIDDWLDEALDLKKRALEVIELSSQSTDAVSEVDPFFTVDLDDHIASKPLVLWNELVGDDFEENFGDVLRLLRDDEVFVIGIHGMGGVGKTCLVTHVKDHIKYQITRNATYDFKHVFWVTVSQNFSIFKLQNDIAKRIGITLDEDDEVIRAEILSSALEKNEKWVLILDDVWNYIDLYKVGIPLGGNGTKLILTSRLKHVCLQMDCSPNNIILMKPLSAQEGWELLLLKLGHSGTSATLPPEVEEVARSIVDICDGLPLGISVMARTMKGVKDISRWRHALNKLQNSAVGVGREMEEEVFEVLKFSYDNLNDINMQRCFLHYALYFEIKYRFKNEFIMTFVDEGLVNGMQSFKEIFDEGFTILDKLKNHSLLLEDEDEDEVGNGPLRMHRLVRDVACHIMGHRYMVRCDKGLRKMPYIQEWMADLEAVSLASNKIEEIPASMSPQCSKLSTLILSQNLFKCIPDCFFSQMNALTVLDLSENYYLKCLPKTMSNLRSLVSLVLRGCRSLEYVPPLGELQKLSRLDISWTAIDKVPQGLEMLTNLKWLDLSDNSKLTFVLPTLPNMQYLDIRGNYCLAKVNAEDVQGMTKLEHFAGSFHDSDNFNNYVQGTLDRRCSPKTYRLRLPGSFWDSYSRFSANDDCRLVCFGDCTQGIHLLPTDIAKLCIAENKQWKCLCDVLSFGGPSSLMHIDIQACPKLERLFCLPGPCSLCSNLQNLESLDLTNLAGLDVIWGENDEYMAHFFHPAGFGMFSRIKHLEISGCHKIEKLLTIGSLLQLQNLVTINVSWCCSMKEIFTVRIIEDEGRVNEITLPKLTRLEFKDLPELKTVWRGIIVCGSSPKLNISGCPKLETHPVLQVFPESDHEF